MDKFSVSYTFLILSLLEIW